MTDDDKTAPPTGSASLGKLIHNERTRQGLSLKQLGDLVGVSKSMVHHWEHDEWVPRTKHLVALSRALELPTADLMAGAGIEYPHDAPSLPAMLRAEYDLPPEAIKEAERAVARIAKKYGATKKPTTKENKQRQKGGSHD